MHSRCGHRTGAAWAWAWHSAGTERARRGRLSDASPVRCWTLAQQLVHLCARGLKLKVKGLGV
eukprot:365608-Chlamydomonas_euryale.AAC.33